MCRSPWWTSSNLAAAWSFRWARLGGGQELLLLRKTPRGLERQNVLPVRFVPMVRNR